MADLNALIAQGAQFRQAPDPFVQYGQMQQLEQNQQTNALNQMKMQEMQRGMETTNALNRFLPGLNESNRSQLLGFGPAGQGVYKALGEGEKERRLAEQAKSQADLNEAKILTEVVARTRNVVAGIDPNDAPSYMALRENIVAQYPKLAPYMPNAWNANVQQSLIVTADNLLERQKPRPPVILRPGEIAIPGNDPRLTGTGVTAPAAALAPQALPASVQEYEYAKTVPGGGFVGAYQDFVKAKADAARGPAPIAAPPAAIGEMRSLGIPETPAGFAYYNELKTKTPVAAPPADSTEMKNAAAFARLKGEPGTPAYNAEFAKQMARLTAKSGGGEGGGGAGVAKAPSGYRVTATGDLEPIPGGPAAGKPLTAAQEIKRRDTVGKEFKSATSALQTTQDVLDSIAFVKSEPGLTQATGFTGMLPSFPEGGAASADVRLANLKGKVTALGKAAAAASGNIGSIATVEWKILADQIANIDPVKGTRPLLNQLDLIEQQAQGAMRRIQDGYERQFGEDFERFPQFSDLPPPKSAIKPKTPTASGNLSPAEQTELDRLRQRFGGKK